jgi:hypothetical protein
MAIRIGRPPTASDRVGHPPDALHQFGHAGALLLRRRFAAGRGLEEHRMTEEIEFDAIHVVLAADLLHIAEHVFPDFSPPIVHRRPASNRQPGAATAQQVFRMGGLERIGRKTNRSVIGRAAVVIVVHPERAEDFEALLTAEVYHHLQRVDAGGNQRRQLIVVDGSGAITSFA